jgi:hypothetical protein
MLILTKIKRTSTLIGGTRPQSVAKRASNIVDITYLLGLLVQSGEKIDFAGYDHINLDRLYTATRAMLEYLRRTSPNTAQILVSCLEPVDLQRVLGDLMLSRRLYRELSGCSKRT